MADMSTASHWYEPVPTEDDSQTPSQISQDNESSPTGVSNLSHADYSNRDSGREIDEIQPLSMVDLERAVAEVQALLIPVSLCMMIVVITIRSVTYFTTNPEKQYIVYASVFKEDDSQSNVRNTISALGNAITLIGVVVVMTLVLVLLFKYRCYRAIKGWLIFSSVTLLMLFGLVYLQQLLLMLNYPVDWITVFLFIWNFGAVGTISIHWRGPLPLTQAYLITSSVLMALVFIKHLPPFTTWAVLAFVAMYDIVAVLCPGGPLKMLVEIAQERDEPLLPSLLYSTTMAYLVTSSVPHTHTHSVDNNSNDFSSHRLNAEVGQIAGESIGEEDSGMGKRSLHDVNDEPAGLAASTDLWADDGSNLRIRRQRRPRRSRPRLGQRELEEARQHVCDDADEGVKLGLGDFIFYSVLIGKAAEEPSWSVTITCFYAILAGLCITLSILLVIGRALPALPVSIALGLFFYLITDLMIVPMTDALQEKGIFF
eukprot:CFRG4448T1